MAVKLPRPRLPSLNALRAFEAAARLESFAAAADELGVTPGAVTQQIRQLEGWLGFALFRRLSQGVEPTLAAREALPRLTRGFDTLGQAVQDLRAGQDGRTLVIAALPCLAQLWLSPRLPALRERFPGMQVSVSAMEAPPDQRRAPCDLTLFYRPLPQTDGPALITLAPDTITPVCTPALARSMTELASLGQATLLHDSVWREDWRRWLVAAGATGVDPARGPGYSLYSLALDATLAGAGVLMGRLSLVAPHLERGELVAPFPLALPTGDALGLALIARDGRARAVAEALIGAPQMCAP